MTRRIVTLSGLLALAAVPAAIAAKPPKSTGITLSAKPTTIVFTKPTTLSGRLGGGKTGGVRVNLEQDTTRPYGDAYQRTNQSTTTSNNGDYSFVVKPGVNTQYRVVAQASPPVTSNPKLVLVRTLVGMRVSDLTPRKGQRVRFSGPVFPAKDGHAVLVQRRGSTGRWVTLKRGTLAHAATDHSSYSMRVRIRSGGAYRVKVPGDDTNVNGYSRVRTLTLS